MKTKTKLKREDRKRLKTKTPKQQSLSLNESASIQSDDYRWTVFRQIINTSLSAGLITDKTKTKTKNTAKLKLKNISKRKSHCNRVNRHVSVSLTNV